MKQITIFANSGHHFHFVPIENFEPEVLEPTGGDRSEPNPNLEAVRKLCQSNAQPWLPHPEVSWIRYRPGRKSTGLDAALGFWIALESNLGNETRGLVYEYETEVPEAAIRGKGRPFRPYAFSDENQIAQEPLKYTIRIQDPDTEQLFGTLVLPLIQWIKPNGAPIDIDLIVDFGNTRTIALLLENLENVELENICRPVRFVRRGSSFEAFSQGGAAEDPNTVVDSWIVLHETLFADFEPPSQSFRPCEKFETELAEPTFLEKLQRKAPRIAKVRKTSYMPQMFVEASPAILGGGNGLDSARQILRDTRLAHDKNFFLSSPKRYSWDGDPLGESGDSYWNIELNRWNPEKDRETPHALPQLKGPLFLFMDEDGRFWDLDKDEPAPNKRPKIQQRPHATPRATFPRRDALTWVGLTILETAYRQISSHNYREFSQLYRPRRLRQVVVTFPSGWTTEEIENYRQQWQKAINVFTLCHFEDDRRVDQGGNRPILVTDLDEAVASQLPVIYSEANRLNDLTAWLELIGRRDPKSAKAPSIARIMNIDIGGGTTDVSVVEYRNDGVNLAVNLNAKLLFKNSSTLAGDSLVKMIIEHVLLDILAEPLNEQERARFADFFSAPREEWVSADPTFRRKIGRIVQLVLVPIVHYWLKQMTENRFKDETGSRFSPERMTDRNRDFVVEENVLRELNAMAKRCIGKEILSWSEPLNFDPKRIERCIRDHFTPLFDSLGKLVAAFDCDLILVSGKPSELPQIRELLEICLPIPIDRIRSAKGFEVGPWYPINRSENRITDAKSITVVGAALRQAMKNGLLTNWRLTFSRPEMNLATGNYWGAMPPPDRPDLFRRGLILKPEQSETTCELMINQNIGRMRFLSRSLMPDQVYRFRWKPGRNRDERNLTLQVKIRRVADGELSELLELVDVKGKDSQGQPVTLFDVELQLKTLPEDAFWTDKPRFEIQERTGNS